MYSNIPDFIPFSHDNLDIKNNLISIARSQNSSTVEGALSSVLIYTNLVDYIARHLLENLLKMISINSFNSFGGVFYLEGDQLKTEIPLGGLCQQLSWLEFPNKKDFIKILKDFNKFRIKIVHSLMKLEPGENLEQIDKDIESIRVIAEDILQKYSVICSGLIVVWKASLPETHNDDTAVEKTET